MGSTEGALNQIEIVMPNKVNVPAVSAPVTQGQKSSTANAVHIQPVTGKTKEFDIFGNEEEEISKHQP